MSFNPKEFNREINAIRRWIVGSASKHVIESCRARLKDLDEKSYKVFTIPDVGEVTCSMINKFKKETLLAHRQALYRKYYDECDYASDFFYKVKKAVQRLDHISVRAVAQPNGRYSLLLKSNRYEPSTIRQVITGLFGKSAFTFRGSVITDSIFVDFNGGKFAHPKPKVSKPETATTIDDALNTINKKIMESRGAIDSVDAKIKELQKDIDTLREEKWKHEETINNIKGKIVW